MIEQKSLSEIYLPELALVFPEFEEQILYFLRKYSEVLATPETESVKVREYALALAEIGKSIVEGIKLEKLSVKDLFKAVISPARAAGEFDRERKVGLAFGGKGKHRYHVLDREGVLREPRNDLLILLQRLPRGKDTGAEVHKKGGIEICLPVVDGIHFFVNDEVFKPKALSSLIVILPGDVHHHIKAGGHGPARVLIIAGFGFSRGEKIEPDKLKVEIQKATFKEIPRLITLD